MNEINKTKDNTSEWFMWDNFEGKYLKLVKKNCKEIYAISLQDNEAALILLTQTDIITLSRYFKDDDNQMMVDENIHNFNSIVECLKYLRSIQIDHAVDYDYKKLVKKLISQLYLNDLIKPEDIIS